MTSPLRTIVSKDRLDQPLRAAASVQTDRRLTDCYLPLIHKLAEMRREQGSGIITGFCAVSRCQGVTYVVESLAWQLAQYTGESILLTSSTGLAGAAGVEFWEPQNIQRLVQSRHSQTLLPAPSWETLQILRGKFGFVLVDCPAMRESSDILMLSKVCDGVALVVAAGESKPQEIEYAQRVLETSSANILGLILNKRTNPVPRFLWKLL